MAARHAWTDYRERGRQLLLPPALLACWVVLNEYADDLGCCPGCFAQVGQYESDRYRHARTCDQLPAAVADLNANPSTDPSTRKDHQS